ncbi:Vacuolar protein sorting-associated protein vps5 [Psilocybe cubensis]|uniref:PX domain-containing protein n=2 Tax=Psilocybe cubensis TaxID=181762 RepID=A0A8H7XT53_PSICU|nr:Vacuolar protein sorting-associated protein vps5 [Psilocybe cubensis]KAH9479365.1 Vacuolar protein sorting-associated protein vps5 [Psilocybe cubensis]
MDGFDDLLAPSRHALEDNPFADPFAKPRSNSPDPWATPFATENAFADSTSPFTTEDPPSTIPDHSDPLDSAAHHSDDDDESRSNPRSPGFRESIPTTSFSETATIRPDNLEEHTTHDSTNPSDIASPAPPLSPTQSSSAPPAPSSSSAAFRTPLDAPLERSVAALSLGGEALGGWQTEHEQTPWQSESFPTPTAAPPAPAKPQDDDDSDDDKPIMQAYQKQHPEATTPTTSSAKPPANGLQPVFTITVDDPQKVGDPIRSFTMYTVHTRTTSPLFAKSSFSVLRRYSDFLWLYETLSANNPGVVVPPVPEKNTFGRFDDQFVRQRRVALEKCITKTANHPVLGKDPDLKMFLESDSFALDIKHRKAEIASEKGGLIASIGQSITGPRFYETDEWFDRQKVYLDGLESQLRGLVKSIELVSKHRVELATATGEFAQNVTELSESDVGKQLAHSLAGLADIERAAQDLQSAQAEHDLTTLMATVDEYARLINSVRLAFSSRIRVYHAWKNQENELLRTKQTHEKNRAQGKIPTDRLGYSLTQIADAERRASDAKLEYEQVSKLVKTEMARFEQERIEDFKESLQAFLEGMISRQKELIAAWVNYQQMLLKKVGGGGGGGAGAAQAQAQAQA